MKKCSRCGSFKPFSEYRINTAFRRRLCGFRCGTQIETRDLEIMK